MQKIEMLVDCLDGGTRKAEAWTSATPGLVCHKAFPSDPGEWNVVHFRTGCIIVRTEDPEQAQAAAAALNGLTDWTASADHIMQTVTADALNLVLHEALGMDRGPILNPHHQPQDLNGAST